MSWTDKAQKEIVYVKVSEIREEIVPVTKSLFLSISEENILVPIQLVAGYTDEDGKYIIRDGRGRCSCARELGIQEVPAIFVGNGPELTLMVHGTKRDNPVSEFRAVQALEREGYSVPKISKMSFTPLNHIKKLRELNKLVSVLLERVATGEIKFSVALSIAKYLDQSQQMELNKEKRITGTSVKAFREASRLEIPMEGFDLPVPKNKQASTAEFIEALPDKILVGISVELGHLPEFKTWVKMVDDVIKERNK